MKWYRTWAIARKETIQVLRDWRSLALAIAIPFGLLILFGFALSLDVDHVPLMVWDQSETPDSRDLISRFSGSPYFDIVKPYANNYHEIEYAIDNREALGALVISKDFSEKLTSGNIVPVQLIIDGSDSNTATIALGYADAIANGFSEHLLVQQMKHLGKEPLKPPLDLRLRVWFNPELESQYTIVPGLIAVIMMVISALLTSLTIAREWERGTMEQLISTPVKVPELIFGKLIPYFFIGMFDVLVVVLAGQFIFGVPLRGSVLLLFGMSIIFMIGSLALGIVISIIAKSQLVASQLAMVSTFLPSFLLSGFFTAITNMPIVIQYVSYIVPARYFMTILKAIYLKGVGLRVLYVEALLLCLYTIIMVTWARLAFKKKLE